MSQNLFNKEVRAILEEFQKAMEVQFALIGELGDAVGVMLAKTDPDRAIQFAERFQMAADVLGSNDD
jgi:hypothetical protein